MITIVWRGRADQVVESMRDAREVIDAELNDCAARGYETRWEGDQAQIRTGHSPWLTIARVLEGPP